jgi:streptogramin lyase
MSTRTSKIALIAAAATVAAVAGIAGSPALAATAPLSNAQIGVHFDLAGGQLPENIATAPNGTSYVTFAASRQVARISPSGQSTILATLPLPADKGVNTPALGFPLTTGIVRGQDGTLYFGYATGTADLTGIWKLAPGGTAKRIAALPATGLPNGLALDARTGMLYVADSIVGAIYRVPVAGGLATRWSTATELATTGFLGVNGLKIRGGAVWATNLDQGTVLRIPITHHGRPGAAKTKPRIARFPERIPKPGWVDWSCVARTQTSRECSQAGLAVLSSRPRSECGAAW